MCRAFTGIDLLALAGLLIGGYPILKEATSDLLRAADDDTASGRSRHVIESAPMHIEAGSTFFDVDGDGDLNSIATGDWQFNDVWENPYPRPTPRSRGSGTYQEFGRQ